MSDLSEIISSAAKDPRFGEILSSLKEKADSGEIDVRSLLGGIAGGEEKNDGVQTAPQKPGMDSHKKLLSALRPYLGDAKRGAVDDILKISEFSGVIEALSKGKDGR